MTLEALVRILKENGNCNVHENTLQEYGKRKIEKQCGFEIIITGSPNCKFNYILERRY